MAYRKTATVQQPIPLRYRCSSCGSEALATLVAEGSASVVIQSRLLDSYDYGTQNKLYRKAFRSLKARTRKFYNKEPHHWFRDIRCQCPNCSNVEPWGNDPDKKIINPFPFILPLSILVFVVTSLLKIDFLTRWIVDFLFKLQLPTAVTILFSIFGPWLIELAIIAGIVFLWSILSPKTIKRKAAMRSLAQENLPKYEKTEKQILEIIEENMKSRIVDASDSGLSFEDLMSAAGQSDSFNR